MNDYERKQEARRDRYERAAERAKKRSEAAFDSARGAVAGIPMGQPILVGHHSEGRHRRDLKRSDDAMRRCVEESKKAEHYAAKAASVGSGGISQDDPDAVSKLRGELANHERNRERIKAVGAAWRKAGRPAPDDDDAWRIVAHHPKVAQDYSYNDLLPLRHRFAARYHFQKVLFPPYVLTNLGANIRRIKQRIEDLERKAQEAVAVGSNIVLHDDGEGAKVVQDYEANRTRIYFPGKPDQETRSRLKQAGFRWCRTESCWQRHRKRNLGSVALGLVGADACLASYANGPGKSYVYCVGCGHVDYEANEGDRCRWGPSSA